MTRRLGAVFARFNARDRRAIGIGALVAGLALVIQVAVRPYRLALDQTLGRVAQERELLAREEALLAAMGTFAPRLERAEAALLAAAPRLLSGADLTTTSAELSSYVAGTASKHRVFIQQSETRPPEAGDDGLTKLRVELRGMGDLEGLLSLIRAIETGPKLLTIEALSIGPAERVNPAEGSDEVVLGFGAIVAGYALASEGEETP